MSAAAVIQTLNSFDPAKCRDELERVQLISATRSLLSKATTPFEFVHDITHSTPMLTVGIKLAHDTQLFEKWQKHGGGAKTTKQLADLNRADPAFLRKWFRILQY
jgi:hypothetical protein